MAVTNQEDILVVLTADLMTFLAAALTATLTGLVATVLTADLMTFLAAALTVNLTGHVADALTAANN